MTSLSLLMKERGNLCFRCVETVSKCKSLGVVFLQGNYFLISINQCIWLQDNTQTCYGDVFAKAVDVIDNHHADQVLAVGINCTPPQFVLVSQHTVVEYDHAAAVPPECC